MHRYIERGELSDSLIGGLKFNLDHDKYCDLVTAAPADDDTNSTVMYQELVKKYGRDFTPENVLDMWVSSQAKYAYFTAERTALINNINGFEAPASAMYKNPFREWIGEQIRADYLGYINPGARSVPQIWLFATRAYRTPKTESTVKCISRRCLHCAPSKAIL